MQKAARLKLGRLFFPMMIMGVALPVPARAGSAVAEISQRM
jgi:hypothetical protein